MQYDVTRLKSASRHSIMNFESSSEIYFFVSTSNRVTRYSMRETSTCRAPRPALSEAWRRHISNPARRSKFECFLQVDVHTVYCVLYGSGTEVLQMYRPVLYEAIRTTTTVRNGKKRKATLQYEHSRGDKNYSIKRAALKFPFSKTDGRF